MVRIFISYAREDQAIAKEIEYRLIIRKYEVFRDVSGIPGGAKWEQELVDRASWCDILLMLITKDSAESKWVFREFREAEKNNKIIFPAQINGSKLPYYLEEINAIPVSYTNPEDNTLDKVIIEISDLDRKLQKPASKVIPQKRFPLISILLVIGLLIASTFYILLNSDNEGEKEAIATNPVTSQAEVATTAPTQTLHPTTTQIPTSEFTPTSTLTRTSRPTNTPQPTSTPVSENLILYEEDFEDGNADRLLHETWSEDRFSVVDDGTGNKVWSGTGSLSTYLYDPEALQWEDYAISVDIYTDNVFAGLSIAFRRLDVCKAYEMTVTSAWHRLHKKSNYNCAATGTEAGSTEAIGLLLSRNQWHNLYIEVKGTTIRWRFDNLNYYEVFDKSFSKGTIGFNLDGSSGYIWLDNIKVWSLDESQ